MSEHRTSNERLLIELRGWHTLKGSMCFLQAIDLIESQQRDVEQLTRELNAARNRIDDDRQTIDRLVARGAAEPSADLYALLVRRGYAQHEAHAIAFGERLAVLSEPPSEVLSQVRNAVTRVIEQSLGTAYGINWRALLLAIDRASVTKSEPDEREDPCHPAFIAPLADETGESRD